MPTNCPRCGDGEIYNDDQGVCDGCIAEDVAISFEDGEADDECTCERCREEF